MHRVAVLDFGGQYTHLIATRIRALGVRADIADPATFQMDSFHDLVGVVLSGGPRSVTEAQAPSLSFDHRRCGVPVLGLCYGHQLLATLFGGQVTPGFTREYGSVEVEVRSASPLLVGLPSRFRAWMSHGDHVSLLPDGFCAMASTDTLDVAAFQSDDRRCFGLQFHPEVTHTEHGSTILDNFLNICQAERTWHPEAYRQHIVDRVRAEAGTNKLLVLVSGGVDSLVCLKLCLEAVGPEKILALHVDTGLMRLDESRSILTHLSKEGFTNVHLIEAGERYLAALETVTDPEEKRRLIGGLFVELVKERISSSGPDDGWRLVQGTIYPDHIESGGGAELSGDRGYSHTIKTHHNRVSEIAELLRARRVIEPLLDLYKDEVRRLGRTLELPAALLDRHPFPGPGLAIRVLCSAGPPLSPGWNMEEAELLALLEPLGLSGTILPLQTVGVQGDSRTYLHPAAIWHVSSDTPDWDVLLPAARLAVNRLGTINRAVWSPRPLSGKLSLQRAYVTEARLNRLRRVDATARACVSHLSDIWQMPVIKLPLRVREEITSEIRGRRCAAAARREERGVAIATRATSNEVRRGCSGGRNPEVILSRALSDPDGREVYAIRPVASTDAMTADVYRMQLDDLARLYRELAIEHGNPILLYDVTSKPPGTIEWE